MTPKISTIMETSIFRTTLVILIIPHSQIFPWPSPLLMFFSKNVLTIEKNQRILPKLLVFPLKKKSGKGGQSGKNPTIGGDLYDQGGSKNQGFHNGRNFGGHFLIQHPVSSISQPTSKLDSAHLSFYGCPFSSLWSEKVSKEMYTYLGLSDALVSPSYFVSLGHFRGRKNLLF